MKTSKYHAYFLVGLVCSTLAGSLPGLALTPTSFSPPSQAQIGISRSSPRAEEHGSSMRAFDDDFTVQKSGDTPHVPPPPPPPPPPSPPPQTPPPSH